MRLSEEQVTNNSKSLLRNFCAADVLSLKATHSIASGSTRRYEAVELPVPEGDEFLPIHNLSSLGTVGFRASSRRVLPDAIELLRFADEEYFFHSSRIKTISQHALSLVVS